MSEPENITQEDWDRLREAAVNLGEAVKTFVTSFTEAVRSIDWEDIRAKLEQARADIEAERKAADDA